MKMLIAAVVYAFFMFACQGSAETRPASGAPQSSPPPTAAEGTSGSAEKRPEYLGPPVREADQPRTVRDYFDLLPEKYFTLESCDRDLDKGCKKAREEYLKTLPSTVDIPNGYLQGGCDGAQACITMAIFKRPNGTHLVGVATSHEMGNEFRFLDYAGGRWTDVSAQEVPEYSSKNWYELPRIGTTMKVYAKKIIEQGDDYEASERGKLLYSLSWKEGKFTKAK